MAVKRAVSGLHARSGTRASARGTRKDRTVWIVIAAMPALLLMTLPVLPIIPMAFTSSNVVLFPPTDWGFGAYRKMLADPGWLEALLFSLKVGFLAVILAVIAGTLAAIGLARMQFRGQGLLNALVLAPLSIPLVVLGLGAFQFFSQLGLNGTLWGITLMHAVLGVPYIFLTVRAALSQLDVSLVRSAMSLGAGPFSVLRWVYIPALRPALIAGGVLVFGMSFDEVVIALFMAGPSAITLPVKLYTELQFNLSPAILAVSTLLLGAVLIAVVTGTVIVARRRMFFRFPTNP